MLKPRSMKKFVFLIKVLVVEDHIGILGLDIEVDQRCLLHSQASECLIPAVQKLANVHFWPMSVVVREVHGYLHQLDWAISD